MKRAKKRNSQVSEEEFSVESFLTMDTFGPHAKLQPGELRDCINLDLYGQYMKTRRGSSLLSSRTISTGENFLAHTVFDSGDTEYLIVHLTDNSDSFFAAINLESGGYWGTVTSKSTGSVLLISGNQVPADLFVSNGKIYVFHPEGNYIFEHNSSTGRFVSRKMGLPAPQIVSAVNNEDAGSTLEGKRVYGVELVYKNTTVTPNVDVIVSGPNRALEVSSPEVGEGKLAIVEGDTQSNEIKVSATLNDGTGIADAENDNWTHIRLYRSKDVTTATNSVPELEGPAEIMGRFDELFQVQEMTRLAFLATWDGSAYVFAEDQVLDDEMEFPRDVVTGDRMELYPMPPGRTGVFHRNRIWSSGVTEFPGPGGNITLENIKSKIFFSPEAYTKYSESVQALSAIESDPGDGQDMIKLFSFQEDLVGIKEGKTGRVLRGDPDAGWITEDQVIGVENKRFAQFVPNVGICAIVNDQKDFRIFGYDFRWHSDFAGLQISRPIRNIIKDWTLSDISFMYLNGKLFVNGGEGEILVLATEQQKGWSRYQYATAATEIMGNFAEGTRGFIVSAGLPLVEIEVEDIETDYNTTTLENDQIDWTFTTHKWQYMGGRSLIEHRWLSLVAILQEQIEVQPYVNGKIWDVPFGMLLDPAEYPTIALQETEYQGYAEVKPIGNYIHFILSGSRPATIYSLVLNCLIQIGSIAPGFDPFDILELAKRVPSWASVSTDIIETGTATNTYTETGTASNDIIEGV